MNYGDYQRDVTHTLTTNLLLGDLYTATVADDTLIANTLVLTAVALVILNRTEDALAEQTITLGLVGTVVDGFGLENLATRLGTNLLGRCKTYRDAAIAAHSIILFVK